MNELGFKTLEELYNKLKPALTTKCHELINNKIYIIKENDIWNYLRENNWKNRSDLTLDEMVDDILNISIENLSLFYNKKENNNINSDLL